MAEIVTPFDNAALERRASPGTVGGGSGFAALGRYAAALGLVAGAVGLGFLVRYLAGAPNVTLVFVLPVVIAATRLGFGASLLAAVAGVLAFDFFFTVPYYSFRIHGAGDMWAAGLLLTIAAIVSTVAAEARRRAVNAQLAADRAEALHDVAHLVAQAAPREDILTGGARALHRIFRAPAVVMLQSEGRLTPAATAGGAAVEAVDIEAAQWSLQNDKPLRGENYPFETSRFDFWPIGLGDGGGLAIGVGCGSDRDSWPENPGRYVELVGAYLAASLNPPRRR